MTTLASLVSDYGLPVVAGAALVYVLLRSEIRIHYSGRSRKGELQEASAGRGWHASTVTMQSGTPI